MLKVYFTRHGETEWNAEKRIQGRLDSRLTARGERDAYLLGERLKDIEFDRIITSPSGRAMQTALALKQNRSLEIATDEELMEIHLGNWQGKTENEIKEQYPEEFYLYYHRPELFQNPEGESFFEVKKRAESFLHRLEQETSSGNILVVTHGVFLKAMFLICRDAPIERIWQPPYLHGTGLTIVEIASGEKKLLLEGCVEHCQQGKDGCK
ncbi:histidine phosphatase family protein [Bacillus sp. FJAT-27251]|uniref:histidine phosphatase family protein n=1 Tax=Bacillus sp. FJAT-27251 TaxID=1684142 RepID=UPI0006A7DA2C|nr:histidine phosphatase family protein [Bacillus sp. FJAT-27251]